MIVAGIEYIDEDAELFPDGSVQDAILAQDTMIQGLPCAKDHCVVYFPNGQLRLAVLSRPTVIDGIPCAARIVYLHENGRLLNASIAVEQDFDGDIVCAGQRVTLDEDGELLEYSRRLNTDQKVDTGQQVGTLVCSAVFDIWLYPSGQTSHVVLASPATIGGCEYPRGMMIYFDEAGDIVSACQTDLDSGRYYKQSVFGRYEASYE